MVDQRDFDIMVSSGAQTHESRDRMFSFFLFRERNIEKYLPKTRK